MIGKSFVLVFCAVFGAALGEFPLVPDPRDSSLPRAEENYRLPNDTKPLSYEIWLEPEFENFTFQGEVEITIKVLEETDVITLHTDDLEIVSQHLTIENEILEVTGTDYDEKFHFQTFQLERPVQPDEILKLSITYQGNLQDNNKGFYRAAYDEDGDPKWFAMTQFESTSARLAFPCYDEPGFKTRFTLHITTTPPYHSFANMKMVDFDEEGGKRTDHFEESVPMPTYLVAFVVSEMARIEKETHAVYAAPIFINDGWAEFALDTGIKVLKAMEDYTDIPFAISKMDQVAVPNNYFSAGAMENWGLVTYRESYLLYKEGISTTATRQTINAIIAHEFGHQWFGNLVSPQWWSWIWLNEGFATYFEQYAADVAIPDMRMMDQFTNLVNYPAMDTEGGGSTRPMTADAQTPREVSSLFDRVAYEKSGAVIRMMEHMLTPAVFKRGLNIYLHAKKYEAAIAQDLWDALQEAVEEQEEDILNNQSVEEIMQTWNTQAGFPIVTVSRENGKIVLSQKYFLMDQSKTPPNNIWTIPISIATATDDDFEDTTASYWLKTAKGTVENIEISDEEWVILNKQATGYYRVNYDELSWQLIIDLLNSEDYNTVHLLNRNQLLEDAFNLARAGVISYNVTFGIASYLKRETDYVPLYTFFKGLQYLNTQLMHTGEYFEIFQAFVREILEAAFNLGEPNSHTTKLNRINVLTWLCRYKHEGCLKLTHDALVAGETASPDFQTPYYCGGLITDENLEEKWTFLYARYTGDEADPTEKTRILSALGCSYSEEHLTRLLDVAIGKKDDYEFGTATSAFSSVYSSSKFGLDFAWNYTIANFETMNTNLPSSQLGSIIGGIASRLTTEESLEQILELQTEFVELISASGLNDTFSNAVEAIEANIEWSNENLDDVKAWLEEYDDSGVIVFALSLPLLIAALLSHLLA